MAPAEPSQPPYRLPRIKREHQAIHREDGTIQIGGDIYGIASAIDDPDGSLWRIVRLIDGTRSVPQLHAESGQPGETVAAVLEALHGGGFLEDAAAQDSAVLSAAERERYSRNQAFYRWIDLTPRSSAWTVQERIKAATVVVVGLGGGGSSVALALAASGVGNLHLVDHDRVELSNLTRQFLYAEADIGRTKVEAAMARLRAVNSTIDITGEETKIESVADLRRLAARCDVLALCADRPQRIRHWADAACREAGVPWVTGGYVGPVTVAQSFGRGDGACVECLHRRNGELSGDAPAVVAGEGEPPLLGNDEVAASTAVSAGLGGLMVAHAVLAHLTGAPDFGAHGFQFGINLMAPEQQLYLAGERHPDCPLCGARA
ncbi:HesA/MoeB/ThiF family protein [Kitasatospora viridis]|uniref:Molybdopterin/thiamine biosynthesis adenylyltransferase n=1 Tax=Kitasatospora viridis TaxID=281105 RepID=A0A561TTB2_9ACTN|nr:ThiF family adenylyltransferase [Kitasatospora viridis]TWF90348.1 molybdopterin/thiamine biosynthesis adenylyltransferase [Kitasatospora viridis]